MKRNTITPAMVELRAAISEAEQVTAQAELSKRDEARVNVLLAKIAALRSAQVAPSDETKRWFRSISRGIDPGPEFRGTDVEAGTQSVAWSNGSEGGYLVPQEFHDELVLGLSQNDPFLDADAVSLLQSNNFSLRPYRLAGWDLSNFTATKVGEGNQRTPQTVPDVAGKGLNSYTYAASLSASLEIEEDDFQPIIDQMKIAFTLAMAKGAGADLANGNGTTAPQGVVTGATDSGVVTGSVLSATDIENIYFSVNRIYRSSRKCAWAMSDKVYEQVRKAHDLNNRPLINVVGDQELLMGKPVLISPTIGDTISTPGIVFGDFGYFYVRTSRMTVSRNAQAAGYVDFGKALYTARMRVDAKVFDPSSGSNPPLVKATLGGS